MLGDRVAQAAAVAALAVGFGMAVPHGTAVAVAEEAGPSHAGAVSGRGPEGPADRRARSAGPQANRLTAAAPSRPSARRAATGDHAGDPAAPAVTPLGWTLAAAARRELTPAPTLARADAGTLATPAGSASPGLFANPVTVAPVVPRFSDGIIGGTITATDSNGLPLFYSLVSKPEEGGKVTLNSNTGRFAHLPDLAVLNAGGTERFSVLVSEKTPLVAALEGLIDLSDFRDIVRGVVAALQQTPVVNLLLAPVIGRGALQQIAVDTGALVPSPADTPAAYTTKIVSFDGTLISTNYFPASGLQAGQTAPAVFTTSGLSAPGQTDPYAQWDPSILFAPLVVGVAPLRAAGYSVVTWDSRGKAASGGVLELGAPEFEGRDFLAIVDHYAALGVITADETGDPLIGTIGGSYGGGMQLVNATLDSRIDAIVPGIAWNTLTGSLYPARTFNTVWGALLPILLLSVGARVNPQVYLAALSGVLFGTIPSFSQSLLARTGPGEQAAGISAPTLLIQGIPDTTFPLDEAVINAQLIDSAGTPVKMIWYCGGHGVCLNPQNPDHDELILGATLGWLDRYVRDQTTTTELPTFQWVDQFGVPWGSDLMPFEPAFHGRPLTATGAGGVMPILSVLGGGGPSLVSLPLSLLATGPATNAVSVSVTAPSAVQIVGAPEVTFSYAGVGTATHLYAQIVDDETGLVLSNGVTPIPVSLNGSPHTVTVSLADVAHNLAAGKSVTLQLSNAALPFYDFLPVGVVAVSDVTLSLPVVADGVAVSLQRRSA